ncbi:hypothetical protein ACGFIY_21210 [Micromonospora chersina]|uniref:hypothetical protein n=1 Tax=Micromonospora chersina TaxID=47854 RepID=UPI00371B224F
MRGTEHCVSHAGKPKEQHKAEGAIRLEVRQWMLDSHDGSRIDPRSEILRLIAFWRWKTNRYGQLIGEAYEAAERLREAHGAGALLTAADPADGDGSEHPALQTARADLDRIFTTGGVAALVGQRYDADRDGRVYAVDEGIRALVKLEGEASDRVARYCALAVQAKVAETRIELAQQVGAMIATVIVGVLGDLGVAADERVMALVAQHMDLVGGGGSPRVIEGGVA